jgi:hypothetical protein
VRIFTAADGPLSLKYATGWRYRTTLNGRPSRVLAVYTINVETKLGVSIFTEVPDDVWPGLKDEVEAILKSFAIVPKGRAVKGDDPAAR